MRTFIEKFIGVLGSFALAIVLLGLLWTLTLIGTFEQAHKSLFDVQEEIFGSMFFVYERGPFPIPMPGAYLVLGLLCVNLVVGGMVRMRLGKSTLGILLAHIGIALLLMGGFIEERWSSKGYLTLYEGKQSDEFLSHTDWELAIVEHLSDGSAVEHVIPQNAFEDLEGDDVRRATSTTLPFDTEMRRFMRNAEIRQVARRDPAGVEGYVLASLEPDKRAEANTAGLVIDLVEHDSGKRHRALLWVMARYPYQVKIGERRFDVDLRRQRWTLPFSIHLDRFVHEMHPGTAMPSRFSSYVKKATDGTVLEAHITMNEPLRAEGYTLYQSGWGPQNAAPGAKLYSTFSVVRNPSDRVPIGACVVIFIGLVMHFARKLTLHIKKQSRRAIA